nr:meiosis regulator and mRNA stability factor 1-like isoform X1 [Haliclona caerulea]
MEEEGLERYIVLTPKLKSKVFKEEIKILLESQPNCCLPLKAFMTAYQRCFGHPCRIADYGFENLIDLIGSVSDVAKLSSNGVNMMVQLIRKDDVERVDNFQTTFQTVSHEVIELLTCEESKQLSVSMVMSKYHEHFGRPLRVSECGFTRLEDLLRHVCGAQVQITDGEMNVGLTDVNIERNLVDLVNAQDGRFLHVSQLSSLYQKHFNKKFTLTSEQLINTVKSSNNKLQIMGVEGDKIICCNERAEKEGQSQALKKLATDLQSLLIKFPGARVSRVALVDIYSHHRGHGIKPQRWGCSSLDSLLQALSDSIEVIGSGDFAAVCLKQEYVIRCLARDLVSLLSTQIGKTIMVSHLPKVYEKHFGHPLCLEHYGFTNLMDIFNSMCSIIKVLGDEKKRLCLTTLQSFAIEAKKLLTHYEGCISLNRFAPCFQQFYNRPLKAADYGYSRLSEVILAIPHVAELRGKGTDKMVVLLEDIDVLLPYIGPQITNEKMNVQSCEACEGNEASDTESVIVEEEENTDSVQVYSSQKTSVEDLIILSSDEVSAPMDWLMAPVPNTVPKPELHPQLQEHPKQTPTKDLISFTEFDSGLCLAGLEQSISSESTLSEQTPLLRVPCHSTSDGQSEALSPGLRQLSDVEAEILNTPKTVLIQEVNKTRTMILTARQKNKSKKVVNPVKLAVNFSIN